MTWRIIKQGWEGCDALSDTRHDIIYGYEELDGAKYVTSNDVGEVCFMLADGRIAWLVSTDLEDVQPLDDDLLREPFDTGVSSYDTVTNGGSNMKEHYFVIKWTQGQGWELDNDTLAVWSDDRPIYDIDAEEWLRVYDHDTELLDFELSKELITMFEQANNKQHDKDK